MARGDEVVGFDNLNDYYDVNLKQARLAPLAGPCRTTPTSTPTWPTARRSKRLFATHKPQRVVNLAAQAGVRYAAENPHVYVQQQRHRLPAHPGRLPPPRRASTWCTRRPVRCTAPTPKMPFSEHKRTEHPLTLYAATKKANELMAHSYAHLYGIPCTGLRFFTVYGPWGRPDMALFLFTKAILAGEPIKVFNHGHHKRSFTYVDDIVEGVIRTLDQPPAPNADWNSAHARSRHQRRRAVSPLQHRQRTAGGTAALHRGAGAVPGPQGADGNAAAAGRRRARHRGRRLRPDRQCRLSPGGAGGGGRGQLRALVPGLLRRLSDLACFKAYDIRGRLGDELNEDIAYGIGRATAQFLQAKRVVVGCDMRASSEGLKQAVIRGLLEQGADVIDLGMTGTEEVYFAAFHLDVDGGIEVTASHNPIDFNGMKLVRAGAQPISGDTGLNTIKQMVQANDFERAETPGSVTRASYVAEYVQHLLSYIDLANITPLKLVVNAGNGAAGHDLRRHRERRWRAQGAPLEFIKAAS